MQERCEETEGKLSAEVAAMELVENREGDVKQGKEEEEEMQRCWKEKMHHHHHGHHLLRPHGHHRRPHHHGPHHHLHHKEKKWEILEKKRMKMCPGKKGSEGWDSKFVGKLKHKLEKIDWKIESLQKKKIFILGMIQEIEEEEEEKKKNETQLPTDAT